MISNSRKLKKLFNRSGNITLALIQDSLTVNTEGDDEMAISEHIEEFSQRLVFCLIVLIFAVILCFADVREIVKIF